MGRHQKIKSDAVLNYLEENIASVGKMAEVFDVTKPTIRSRLRELRKEKYPIIHGGNGVMLINAEELTEADIAEAMAAFLKWNLEMLRSIHLMSTPMKPLLPLLKKTLRLSYSPEERRELAVCCQRVKALIDWVEIDQEME